MNQQLTISTDKTGVRTLEDYTLTPVYQNGALYTFTSVYVEVYDGATFLSSGTLTPTSDYHKNGITYTWDNTTEALLTTSAKANYLAIWNFDSGNKVLHRYFDVVLFKMLNPIDITDIEIEKPELLKALSHVQTGTVSQTGTTTTMKCSEFSSPSNFYNGSQITFRSGRNIKAGVTVNEWNSITKTFTFNETLAYAPIQGETFELHRSYNPEIISAWNEIISEMNAWVPTATDVDGLSHVVDPQDLRLVHLYKSIVKICQGLRMKEKDTFDLWVKEYSEKEIAAINGLRLKIDTNEDGRFDTTEDTIRSGVLWFQH